MALRAFGPVWRVADVHLVFEGEDGLEKGGECSSIECRDPATY
jgi:hypothetical protein